MARLKKSWGLTDELASWELNRGVFSNLIKEKETFFSPFEPEFLPEPAVKTLIFLVLIDSNSILSYDEIHQALLDNGLITGKIPGNTLRTSALNLKRTLISCNHSLALESDRGFFKLVKRDSMLTLENSMFATNKALLIKKSSSNKKKQSTLNKLPFLDPAILLLDESEIQYENIASTIIQKSVLPFKALFLLEWSARWWESYSNQETQLRIPYEVSAWENLGIRERLFKADASKQCICFVGLATSEGLSEIGLLKKIFEDSRTHIVHYLSIETSPRLLRDHLGLIKEVFAREIKAGRLLFACVIADIFLDMSNAVERARYEFLSNGMTQSLNDFLPVDSPLLVTYLGNCLGNNFPDQEAEIFSLIKSTFHNRPLEFLVGVSVIQDNPEQYARNWDAFLMQMPRYLLDTSNLLESLRDSNSPELPEFVLSGDNSEQRCPPTHPEFYTARHGIQGQIYRFYYKLDFDLILSKHLGRNLNSLSKNTLILLFNIIKYDIKTLINGIETGMSFMVEYDENFHRSVETDSGKREYTLFSAYLLS